MSSLFSGFVAGLTVAMLQHFVFWRYQRRLELRRSAFDAAVVALGLYETDAMDVKLQSEKPIGMGLTPTIALRDETKIATTKALALVPAFFTKDTADAYRRVFSVKLNHENIPNEEYYTSVRAVMPMLAREVDPPSFWDQWLRR